VKASSARSWLTSVDHGARSTRATSGSTTMVRAPTARTAGAGAMEEFLRRLLRCRETGRLQSLLHVA
jgi:hypothetical protein